MVGVTHLPVSKKCLKLKQQRMFQKWESPLELNLGLIQEDFYLNGHFLQKQVTFCKRDCLELRLVLSLLTKEISYMIYI